MVNGASRHPLRHLSGLVLLVVSKETRDKVDAAAEQANMSVSKWLRRASSRRNLSLSLDATRPVNDLSPPSPNDYCP